MKILVVTYCFGSWNGQALIGVYKRGLRVAMGLRSRGHQVFFLCTGREIYQDELTAEAERSLEFIDISFEVTTGEGGKRVSAGFREKMVEIGPEAVVVGEVPLAGAMLEATQCAIELGIPLVILDNAYRPDLVHAFHARHGSIANGIVLCGPTSFQSQNPPPSLCQVPAFVELTADSANSALAATFGLRGDRLIAVLAYDEKVERLAVSLLGQIGEDGWETVFLARQPDRCGERVNRLPENIRKNVRVTGIPADPVLFGLIKAARLAICKYGFMQVSECLSLQTPVIAVYHEGPCWLDALPKACRPLTWWTAQAEADPETVSAAKRLLATTSAEAQALHSGGFDAVGQTVEFVESVAGKPPQYGWGEAEALGFGESAIGGALRRRFGTHDVKVAKLRAMLLREWPGGQIYCIVCQAVLGGRREWVRLWGRRHLRRWDAFRDWVALKSDPARHVYYFSLRGKLLIESDIGQGALPPI